MNTISFKDAKQFMVDFVRKMHKNRNVGYTGVNLQIEVFTSLNNYEEINKCFIDHGVDLNKFFSDLLLETKLYYMVNKVLLPINRKNEKISLAEYRQILSFICDKIRYKVRDNKRYNCQMIKDALLNSKYSEITISDILVSFYKHKESLNDFVENELNKKEN